MDGQVVAQARAGQLFGRRRELDELTASLDDVAGGRGRLFVLVGEPGIGKTSLADAIASAAEARGFAVAWGRCWDGGGAPPLWAWRRVFAELGLDLPEISTEPTVAADGARLATFERAAAALAGRADDRPLVIVLDDLHAADAWSLSLLLFVASELRRMRVLIVGTRRDVEGRVTPEVRGLLARLARGGASRPLRRLDRDEVAAIVAARRAAPEVGGAIWEATQGNPFFVDELLRVVATLGERVAACDLPIPSAIRETIRERVAEVDDATRALLDVAAVAGDDPEVAVVALAAGVATDDAITHVATAVEAGVLVERSDGRLRFAHGLIGDVLVRDLSACRRVELHLRIADAVERLYADEPPAARIARHALAAAPRDPARLIARVERACHAWLADGDVVAARALIDELRRALEPVLHDGRLAAELARVVGDVRRAIGETSAVIAATPLPPPEPAARLTLARDGELWAITHGARTFRMRDSVGLRYLARLIAAPDRELCVLDLAGAAPGVDAGDAGAMIDAEARRCYARRLDAIDHELAQGEAFGDPARVSRARAERELLARELSRAVGLGGRARRAGAAMERARVAVTRRIRDAVRKIASEDPELGRHLDDAVRTGRFCCYRAAG
jgi:hypothetical protein